MSEKPDPLELNLLLSKAKRAVNGSEKAALFRQAAEEARSWATWHDRQDPNHVESLEIKTDGSY